MCVAEIFSAQEAGDPGNDRREKVERRPMIVLRIVVITALADQCHQEVSVDAFIVMKRDQGKIIKPQESPHD